jgi:hypothetical protein
MLDYYMISEDSRENSFSKDYLAEIGRSQLVKNSVPVQTLPLKEIFELYPIPEKGIDYLNIDAEGFDLDIILSNDFNLFRPKIISVEVSPINLIEDIFDNIVYKKLVELKYSCVAKNFIIQKVSTLFFIDSRIISS